MTTQATPKEETAEERQKREELERKRAEAAAKREERHRMLQGRTADGLDKAVKTIKVTAAKLDETADAESIATVEEALDTLRGVRDSLRAASKGQVPAPSNEQTGEQSGEQSGESGEQSGESGENGGSEKPEEAPKREPVTAGNRR